MKLPKMILFDYGQTLVDEGKFNGIKGTEAVLKYATKNKYGKTPAEVQAYAEEINKELGRFDPLKKHLMQVEIPNHMFTAYLYESQGIELSLSPKEIDKVFWDAVGKAKPTEGIEEFLAFLRDKGIRTGVISNITFCSDVVKERIAEKIPSHEFEFIIATSEYMFRKPNRKIFEFALEKAGLFAEDVWYIGDQYECDIVGAGNAGIFPVWYIGAIDLPYSEKEDVLMVKSWRELREMMEKE